MARIAKYGSSRQKISRYIENELTYQSPCQMKRSGQLASATSTSLHASCLGQPTVAPCAAKRRPGCPPKSQVSANCWHYLLYHQLNTFTSSLRIPLSFLLCSTLRTPASCSTLCAPASMLEGLLTTSSATTDILIDGRQMVGCKSVLPSANLFNSASDKSPPSCHPTNV
ncbi:hypothetical protein POM88_050099 [Heracleum sosnowskyi]|uniref:Uncharacterized protein n=1 Tax=Heracleum sosnowskyi TaxID=360622 RepID=A0AAD8GY92_9APIA|nr:hypothetical protein POM88_050099 [Heracleum sosnowskyi]